MTADSITKDEALRLMAETKLAADLLQWVDRKNHQGSKICASILVDSAGVTLPGLTVVLEVRSPVVAQSCLYLFTLMQLSHGKKRRVYQLEVVPPTKRSHNGEAGAIYGPHEHVGPTDEPTSVTDPAVSCADWQACLAWFLRRCNLSTSDPGSPC